MTDHIKETITTGLYTNDNELKLDVLECIRYLGFFPDIDKNDLTYDENETIAEVI